MLLRKTRKTIAAFFLLVMAQSVLAPCISYALTAGPTAPEATSFEPVDTTDLVDLKSGDFTYNMPLLEVPGPAGGYPLSLSYHAGIQPNQEASWTGLGWILNPGSISRLVNGYPDDHNNVTNVDRSFWEGGETETYTVGVSVGMANVANVSAGMSFAQDTYKGFGIGQYMGFGVGYKINDNVGIGANFTTGTTPFGDSYTSAGLSLGLNSGSQQAFNLSANVGLSVNSRTGLNAGAGAGVGVGFHSLMDVSISSSGGNKALLAVGGGAAGVYNSRANKVSINSESFQADIPVWYGVSVRLGRDYQRYWIDEKESVSTFGSLYLNSIQPDFLTAFDTYDLLDTEIDIAFHNNPEKVLGGSFPDYDLYTVTAQGLSGNIRPYHFQQHLYRQDKRDAADNNRVLSKSYPLESEPAVNPVEFRFVNDFSNRFEHDPDDFTKTLEAVTFDFNDPVTGKEGNDSYQNNHLIGSKHVEWHSNHEILSSSPANDPFAEGFINCVADGFLRDDNDQVGGFSITNTSGVTYHYALPVYSFGEYMKSTNSETKQTEDGLSYNELKKPEKYAYTWYLTAVTGPDFVDRNSNGLADHGDWGYWVSFEYKKWLSDYKWRNPGKGINRDVDGDFEFYAFGNKEIYYLEKIATESHVAIFEKSERLDGREVLDQHAGSFEPIGVQWGKQSCIANCVNLHCFQGSCTGPAFTNCMTECNSLPDDEITYTFPRTVLKLDKIKLYTADAHLKGLTNQENILREITFGYDNTLAVGTPNSYSNENFSDKQGKLTLNSIEFKGKKGESLIPPTTFSYKNEPYGTDGHDKFDVWGFYKSDYTAEFRDQTNEIIGRATTEASSQHVDAWSLNEITTPLGATVSIEYESDKYDDVILSKQQILRTKDVTDHAQDKLKITFWEDVNLTDYFQVGESVEVDLIGNYNTGVNDGKDCTCNILGYDYGYSARLFSTAAVIDEINNENGYIIINNPAYYNKIKNETKVFEAVSNGINQCEAYSTVTCEFTFSGANAWPDYFAAGTVSAAEKEKFGGGLRVKSVALSSLTGGGRVTSYGYEHGVTSYEPFEILAPKILPSYPVNPISTKLFYKQSILNKLYKQIGISRNIPGPGVMYKSVTVHESNVTPDGEPHEIPNYARYEFETFNVGMTDVVQSEVNKDASVQGSYEGVTFNGVFLNQVTLKDFSSRVGNLKSITTFNTDDDSPVAKTINHYLHDDLDGTFNDNITEYEDHISDYSNQGLIEETYSRARIMLYKKLELNPYFSLIEAENHFENNERKLLGTISKLETFPTIAIGQTNINYKTNVQSSTENLAFDFYSGDATQVLTKDSYGNRYLSVSTPAYKEYQEMSSKVLNKQNKNMLSQITLNESFLVDEQNVRTGLLSAAVQTWSKDLPVLNVTGTVGNIWRKHAAFQWNGQEGLNDDGSYPFASYTPFSWEENAANSNWEKTGELTLYNTYSHALEAKDVNGNFASTRMTNDQQKVIGSAVNAAYNEVACAGAEYYSGNIDKEGSVDRGQGNPATAHAHTGKFSLLVGTGKNGFNYTLTSGNADLSRKYRASVWVYAPGNAETQEELNKIELYYTLNGQDIKVHPELQKNKSKSWYLLNIDINPSGASEVYIGVRNNSQRGVYFDDFRVHPLDASLVTYVYDDFSGELSFILDANNFYTRFQYDAMGRLLRTSKELLNFDYGTGKESFRADAVLNETKYNYGKGN